MVSEATLHENVEKLRGEWEIKTGWGVIRVALRPLRVGYGTKKGRPDEFLIVEVSFPIFGERIHLQAPVLLEAENGGLSPGLEDLKEFSRRTSAGEQESHIKLPMIISGKERKPHRKVNVVTTAKIDVREIPSEIIETKGK